MAKIPHIVNASGTNLKKYKLKHLSGGTEEEVELTFSPSDDYTAGTPFNEATMNPIIDEVNNKGIYVESVDDMGIGEELDIDHTETITSATTSVDNIVTISFSGNVLSIEAVGVGTTIITINGTRTIDVTVVS